MRIRDVIDRRIEWVNEKHGDHPIKNHTILHLKELKKDFEAFGKLDTEI